MTGICYLQETKWRGSSVRMIGGKDIRYKFFWMGNDQGTGGVGILIAEKWVEHVVEVKWVSERICSIKVNVSFTILTIFSIYAP